MCASDPICILYEIMLLTNASVYQLVLLVLQHTQAVFFLCAFRKETFMLCVLSEILRVFTCMYLLFHPMEGYCHNTFLLCFAFWKLS